MDEEVGEIEQAIVEVDRKLVEIDRARIRGRVPFEELNREEKETLSLQKLLQKRLDGYDPSQIEMLERARSILRGAEGLEEWARTYGRYQVVNRGGIKGFVPIHPPPVDEDVARLFAVGRSEWFREDPELPLTEEEAKKTFVDLLDRLHAEIIVHSDRIKIRGVVPMMVPLDDGDPLHANRVPRGLG